MEKDEVGQVVLETWEPAQRVTVIRRAVQTGPQVLLSNGPHGCMASWVGALGRSSHREAVAGVQRETMAAWTRLLAVGIEGSGSFPRELGGSFVRIEELRVVGGKGSCRM